VTVVLVSALAAACSGGGDTSRSASPTVREEPSTTTAPVVPVDLVPAVIDVAYIQRVIDALDHVEGDAVRELVRAGVPNRAFYERLRAVYLDPEFQRVQTSIGASAANGLQGVAEHPSDPVTRISRLITASAECIFVGVDRNFGPMFKEPPTAEERHTFLALGRTKSALDPAHHNPTAWMIGFDGRNLDGSEPRNPCA
jgi:hypothetical protein